MQRWRRGRSSGAGRVGGNPEEAAPGPAEAEDAAEGGQGGGGRGAVGQDSLRYEDRSYVNVVLPSSPALPILSSPFPARSRASGTIVVSFKVKCSGICNSDRTHFSAEEEEREKKEAKHSLGLATKRAAL